MRKLAKQAAPGWLKRSWLVFQARSALARVDRGCPTWERLATLADFGGLPLLPADAEQQWAAVENKFRSLAISDDGHGVNCGDRRALYHLVRRLAPAAVLEVGTHIGASTAHIAAAMADAAAESPARPLRLVSVDVRDVNDRHAKPWTRYGCRLSPYDKMKRLGVSSFVEFVTRDSIEYLRDCRETFDLVFLDGDHSAPAVYQELVAAAALLNPSGLILLHDYFPRMKPLWSNGVMQPGPCLAAKRLRREGAALDVLPLGSLPWPTKLGSTATSLALVVRAA